MARNRREVATTNLSFIDAMSVGLGAAILLFMILHHATEVRSTQKHHAIAEKVSELEDEVLKKRQAAEQQAAALQRTEEQLRAARARAQAMIQELETQPQDDGSSRDLEELQSQVLALQERVDELRSEQQADAVRAREGEGRRQYLTGMDVRGKRILVLMDTSASMLDETVLNVILRRNRSEASRQQAPKWRWALNAVDWLSTQIPETAQFQVYSFNTQVDSVVGGTTGRWLRVGDGKQLNSAIGELRDQVPQGGTSLTRAFEAAAKLSPQPDNIYLLTDGLPTQGSKIRGGTVNPNERINFFNQAVRRLPRSAAVHVMLFPMEGDASAAGAFWQLAQTTGGSFMTPSRDWP